MLRKIAVILTMLLASVATQVYALGLGSVSVESALNQPLRVRIEILQLGDTRLEDVNVQMASVDDFQRFNIERVGFLSNIRFSVEATAGGNFVTLISSQIVREPYLSFILETRWPNGRLLSEHTILLDLPVFDDQQASATVRTPISPVLQRPDAVTQPDQPFVEPAVPAVTPPTQSVQPVLEPEIIDAPALQPQDLTPQPEEVIPEPESVTQETETLPVDPAQEETAEPVDEPELAVEEDPQAVEPTAEAVVEEQAVAVVEEPVEEAIEEQAVAVEPEPEPVQAEVTEEIEPEPAPVEETEEIAADETPEAPDLAEEIETTAADTLSDIALRVRPSNSVTIQQTMLALQQLNPDAFVDGNINELRSGQVMRVPTLAEVEAIGPQEAIDEVTRQNQQVAEVDVEPLAAPSDATPDQDDLPQGQLSVVSSDDADAIDASTGVSELNEEENVELDRRIAELENQLALRQEEADRARIEREDLDSRMAELEEQIADAQEIIRLQDLQLAQLQETLAAAAAEAAAQAEAEAAQAALVAAAEAEAAMPLSSPSNLFDDVMRILTGNTLMTGFGLALAILLLVFLLLRRNKAAKSEDESLDELAEQEFPADAEDSAATATADEEAVEQEDTISDSELDELISGFDEDGADADSAAPADMDELSASVDAFIEDDQLQDAVRLLESAVDGDPDNHELRLKLLEVLTLKGDLALFDHHAEILATELSPVIDRQVENLREQFGDVGPAETETETEPAPEQEVPTQDEPELEEVPVEADVDIDVEAEAEVVSEEEKVEPAEKSEETASFLDDLGINLDSFDEESFEFSNEEDTPEEEPAEKEEASAQESAADDEDSPISMEFDEPADKALTFDLGGDDESTSEGDKEVAQDESVQESEAVIQDEPDADDEATEESDAEEPQDEEDDLEDLGFLSDEEEVEIESVGEVVEVEMVSDDETATKLELAYAYQKMGDTEGAEEILQEVIKEGSKEQVKEAENLLASLNNPSD